MKEKKKRRPRTSTLNILLKSWSGKIGIALLILQVILAGYAVIEYGKEGFYDYTQSNFWSYKYPQSVPPCWATDKAPYAKIDLNTLELKDQNVLTQVEDPYLNSLLQSTNSVYIEEKYIGSINYEAEALPSDTALALIIRVGNNSVVKLGNNKYYFIMLNVYLIRPDGQAVEFYNGTLTTTPGNNFIQLYGKEANITIRGQSYQLIMPYSLSKVYPQAPIEQYLVNSIEKLKEYLASKVNVAPEELPVIEDGRLIVADIVKKDNNTLTYIPLNGNYSFIIDIKYAVAKEYVTDSNDIYNPNIAKMNDATVNISTFVFEIRSNCYGFFGTDTKSRPIGLGLLFGLPYAFILGFTVTFVSTFIGTLYGIAAGYWKDIKGEILMRIVDIVNSLPFLPILIALSVAFRSAITLGILAVLMIILFWAGPVIVVRSMALQISEQTYVEAAKAVGVSTRRILFKHMFPQVFPYAMAIAVLSIPGVIVAEASLSLLGFGDPAAPTWGKMLQLAYDVGAVNAGLWWLYLFPGLALVVFSATFLLVGRALEPIVAPKLIK